MRIEVRYNKGQSVHVITDWNTGSARDWWDETRKDGGIWIDTPGHRSARLIPIHEFIEVVFYL